MALVNIEGKALFPQGGGGPIDQRNLHDGILPVSKMKPDSVLVYQAKHGNHDVY